MESAYYPRAVSFLLLAAVGLVVLGNPTASAAQWTVYYLNPPGSPGSGGECTTPGQHVGYVRVGGACYDATVHAAIWDGTTSDWTDLHPTGAQYSAAYGATGTQQAGIVRLLGENWFHAALWSGTPESFVDLHPPGAQESSAYGIGGAQQVGYVTASSPPLAALWEGTAESYVNLNPAGAQLSVAISTNGQQQAGYMKYDYIYGDSHAALWSGSANSFVDLHPSSAVGDSAAFGVSPDGNEQVGYVQVQVGQYVDAHAAIWHGVADEWIDLNPPGAIYSELRATDGMYQAGQAYAGEGTYYTYRAYLWAGSVSTRVDLHALLPSEYTMSEAEDVYSDAAGIWVFGYAHRTGVQCDQAILWHLPMEMAGDLNCDGVVDFGDINPFVLVLADPAAWQAMYPDCPMLNGDVNGDEVVGFGDINPFVGLLSLAAP
jgi:hypothetical protein